MQSSTLKESNGNVRQYGKVHVAIFWNEQLRTPKLTTGAWLFLKAIFTLNIPLWNRTVKDRTEDVFYQGHSNCIFKFPVFSLSDRIFSLCHLTWFVTITYTKLTLQTCPALESGNLQLEQTKFPVFGQNSQIPCVFTDREFCYFPLFSCFPCAVGTLFYPYSQSLALPPRSPWRVPSHV